jgi:hypothetical protein
MRLEKGYLFPPHILLGQDGLQHGPLTEGEGLVQLTSLYLLV